VAPPGIGGVFWHPTALPHNAKVSHRPLRQSIVFPPEGTIPLVLVRSGRRKLRGLELIGQLR
jgi:hypothetical protein